MLIWSATKYKITRILLQLSYVLLDVFIWIFDKYYTSLAFILFNAQSIVNDYKSVDLWV